MIIFETWGKVLLFTHLVAAFIAASASVHLVLYLISCSRGKGKYLDKVKSQARTLLASYVITFITGAMMYPAFRVRVRHDFLDAVQPSAAGLFEIKEHFAALGLLPLLAVFFLVRQIDFEDPADRRCLTLVFCLIACAVTVIGFDSWSGWFIVTLRSI